MATEGQRRRNAATATATGLGVAAGSGVLRERQVQAAFDASGETKRPKWYKGGKVNSLVRHGTKAQKYKYAAGAGIGLIGTTGTAMGIHDLTRRRKPQDAFAKKDPLVNGLERNLESVKQRAKNLTEKKPPELLAATTAIGVGGGGGAAFAAHGLLDRAARKGKRISPTKRGAITGAAAALGTAGVGRLTKPGIERKYPDYEVSPIGVTRRKKPIVRPSSTTTQHNERDGKSTFRRGIVGKAAKPVVDEIDEETADYWYEDDTVDVKSFYKHPKGSKHSLSYAKDFRARLKDYKKHGLGDHAEQLLVALTDMGYATPRTHAVNDRPRDNKGRFVRTGGSSVAKRRDDAETTMRYPGSRMSANTKRATIMGAAAVPVLGDWGSAATAARLAPPDQRRHAGATQLAGNLSAYAGGAAGAVAANRYLPKPTAERLDARIEGAKTAARAKVGMKPKATKPPKAPRAGKPAALGRKLLKPLKTPAGKVGFLVGGAVTGQIGGNAAVTHNNRRERERRQRLRGVSKADIKPVQTKREHLETIKRKRRTLAAGQLSNSIGLAGVGLLGASTVLKKPKLADLSFKAGVAAGGIGSAQGLRNSSLVSRDLKRERAQVLAKALGTRTLLPRAKGYRASALVRRPGPAGTLRVTRRAGGVA